MDLRSMDISGFRHNNKGFYVMFTFLKFINWKRTTIIEMLMHAL